MFPYSYYYNTDGAAVGKYNPVMEASNDKIKMFLFYPPLANHPKVIQVPKDRFVKSKHRAFKPKTRYPKCTKSGDIHCSLTSRKDVRGSRVLTKSIINRLQINDFVESPKKKVEKNDLLKKSITMTGESESGDIETNRTN